MDKSRLEKTVEENRKNTNDAIDDFINSKEYTELELEKIKIKEKMNETFDSNTNTLKKVIYVGSILLFGLLGNVIYNQTREIKNLKENQKQLITYEIGRDLNQDGRNEQIAVIGNAHEILYSVKYGDNTMFATRFSHNDYKPKTYAVPDIDFKKHDEEYNKNY